MKMGRVGAFVLLVVGAVGTAVACGSSTPRVFEDPDGASSLVDARSDGPTFIDPDSASPDNCPAGSETRISGKVYDPAGRNPLYNIQVYVPSGELPQIKFGLPDPPAGSAVCGGQTCDSEVQNPLASALSNTKGEFVVKGPKLFGGKNVPLVMQVGKWRRKIVIPEVKPCQETKLSGDETRLPRNRTEGDLPQIMMALGDYDALECLLTGIGVTNDEFEAGFTTPSKHVHVFRGIGGGQRVNGQPVPDASNVWDSAAKMQNYDIALLACEGTPDTVNKPANLATMKEYTTKYGGRVFATHYHAQWAFPSAWGQDVLRTNGATGTNPYPINMTFPKGQAFAEWLVNVGASTSLGTISLSSPSSYQGGLASPSVGEEWIGRGSSAKYVSFNTPVGVPAEQQCGRFVVSDVHAAGDASGGEDLPNTACSGLNAQLAAIEFMFFDLSSCVQDQNKPPAPPK